MPHTRSQRIVELFTEAALLPAADRDAILEQAGDLRAEVEKLLEHDESASRDFLTSIPPGVVEVDDLERGKVIDGRYEIDSLLGEGGMGRVYRAKQIEPIERTVALKVIKLGMDTRQVVARFNAERQVLAMMNHPGIARVFDAGATERGRPYFVMELVEGVPITEFCDARRLTIDDRLRLFADVCRAVQHAHQKGVIHRDLKTSNVLVTERDRDLQPIVIDFGIAKATADEGPGGRTTAHRIVGTPEIMSPEQAGHGDAEPDTRTDIYSLGVLLYELLVGAAPFDGDRLRSAGYVEALRIIREEAPGRPSARAGRRLRDDASGAEAAAANRQTTAGALERRLRGDLDWIVMRAIARLPDDRYATAAGLANDVAHHLHQEPVIAGPPSNAYRLRKFVRRHRPAVAVASLIVLIIAVTGVGQGLAWAEARRRATVTDGVLTFLTEDLLRAVSPEEMGKDVTMRQVLDQAAASIDGRFPDEPLVEARCRIALGDTYADLGEYVDAETHLERAVELHALAGDEDSRQAIVALTNLGVAVERQGDRKEDAGRLKARALQLAETELGADDPDTLIAKSNYALYLIDTDDLAEAERLLDEVIEVQEATLGPDHRHLMTSFNNLAVVYSRTGRPNEAVDYQRRALDTCRATLGPLHPQTLQMANNLGYALDNLGRFEEAEPLYREALAGRREVLGPDHGNTINTHFTLASLLRTTGRLEEAEPELRSVLEVIRVVRGDDHPHTLMVLMDLGKTLCELERYDEAEPVLAECAVGHISVRSESHVGTGVALVEHGKCLLALGRHAEALAKLEHGRAIIATVRPTDLESLNGADALIAEARTGASGS